jgi:hypothetical protein
LVHPQHRSWQLSPLPVFQDPSNVEESTNPQWYYSVSFIRFSGSTKFDKCLKWSLKQNGTDNPISESTHEPYP